MAGSTGDTENEPTEQSATDSPSRIESNRFAVAILLVTGGVAAFLLVAWFAGLVDLTWSTQTDTIALDELPLFVLAVGIVAAVVGWSLWRLWRMLEESTRR